MRARLSKGNGWGMRVGMVVGIAVGVGTLALSLPAAAKDCVEPYGELVAVSDVETIVRVKPECAALAALAEGKTAETVSLASALLVEPDTARFGARTRLPEPVELAARPSKRAVSCSDPAVCGHAMKVAEAKRPSRCEYGRAYAVGVSPGLTEVRIYDDCRYLMNPKPAVTIDIVPTVLAPDWELDTSPSPEARRRRGRSTVPPAGIGAPPAQPGAPKTQAGVRAESAKPRTVEPALTRVAEVAGSRFAVVERRMAVPRWSPAVSRG